MVCSRLGEQRRHSGLGIDVADSLGEHVSHGQVLDLLAAAILVGDGVQEDDLVQSAVGDAADGGAGQDAVGSAGGDGLGAADLDRALAAWHREPPVSTMSSSRMTCLSLTSPMMFMTSEELAF